MAVRNLLADLHQGFRLLTRAPGFSTLAVLILASGIGAATMMFSLVHAALLRALPFDDPDRVVWMYNLRTERDRAPLSAPDVDDYRREASSFAALAVFTNWTANLTGVGIRSDLKAHASLETSSTCSASVPSSDVRYSRKTRYATRALSSLTHGLWMRRFGSDRQILGARYLAQRVHLCRGWRAATRFHVSVS